MKTQALIRRQPDFIPIRDAPMTSRSAGVERCFATPDAPDVEDERVIRLVPSVTSKQFHVTVSRDSDHR